MGPSNFGPGGITTTAYGSGDIVGIGNAFYGVIFLPRNYKSGAALYSTATYQNATFATLGMTAGTYAFAFGSGATADSFIVNIGGAVPEPASWTMMIAGFGMVGGAMRRKSACITTTSAG